MQVHTTLQKISAGVAWGVEADLCLYVCIFIDTIHRERERERFPGENVFYFSSRNCGRQLHLKRHQRMREDDGCALLGHVQILRVSAMATQKQVPLEPQGGVLKGLDARNRLLVLCATITVHQQVEVLCNEVSLFLKFRGHQTNPCSVHTAIRLELHTCSTPPAEPETCRFAKVRFSL